MKKQRTSRSNSSAPVLYSVLAFALPLIVVPLHLDLSKPLRWGVLLALAVLLLTGGYAARNFRQLHVSVRLLLGFIAGMAVLGTLLSQLPFTVRLIGWDTEYLGILSWLAFLVIAVGLRTSIVSFLKSRWALMIGAAILVVSFVMDYAVLYYGYRFAGAFQQATNMGMFAAIVLLLALWHLTCGKPTRHQKFGLFALLILSIVSVLLTQSRIAQAGGLLVCFILLATQAYQRRRVAVVPLLTALLLVTVPMVFHGYFHRLQAEQVQEGFSYRAELYRSSFHDVLSKHPVIGLGASGIPETINSRQDAPPEIAESLDTGFVFLSSHDIFLDTALCFGMLAGLAFVALVAMALYGTLSVTLHPENVLIGSMFLLMLLNGIFNVPTIEMTLLLFVTMTALLPGIERKQ